jgi:poly(3-hydroxybutyrate) depolymerase
MLYQYQEFQKALLQPLTAWAQATAKTFVNPTNPLSLLPAATRIAAGYEWDQIFGFTNFNHLLPLI